MSPAPFDLGDGAVLRRYTMDDLDALWGAVEEERDRIGAWMPWVALTRTRDDEAAWMRAVLADERSLEGCGIFVEGAFAGGCGMHYGEFRINAEIGYWIRERFEGRGLVTRAVERLMDEAFDVAGVHRVFIRAGVDNARSRAIPERLGFTREGVLRGDGRGTHGYYDLVMFSMLEDEWRARRAEE